MNKPTRGGKRQGAGRKPTGRKSITFRLSPDVIKKIKSQPNQSDYLENLIRKDETNQDQIQVHD